QTDLLFDTARNLSKLIGHHLLALRRYFDKAADRVADRNIALALEAAFNPVTLVALGREQFEGKGHEQRILRMVHDSLRPPGGTAHFAIHRQSNGIKNRRFTAARRTKNAEQPGIAQSGKINFLHAPVALKTG